MAILGAVSNILANIGGRITAVKRNDDNLYFVLDAFKNAINILAQSLAVTDGSFPSSPNTPGPGSGGNGGGGTTIITQQVPACKAHMLTDFNIADNTSVAFDWDEIEYDDANFHSTTSNNTQFYASTAGVYRINVSAEITYPVGGTVGRISLVLYRIGAPTTIQAIVGQTVIVGAFTYWLAISCDIYLQAGESVLVQGFNQGSGRTAVGSGTGTTGHKFPMFDISGPFS